MSSLNESQSTALRLELFREIAPAALSDMKANPPAADESTQSYARRLLNTATARTNWAQAARVVDAFQRFGVAEAILDTNDQQALVLFSTGLRRERAGEFALASHSFQRVLSMESQAIPPELVGEHLAAIRRAHPKDYELGVAWTVNPPIPEWVLLRQGPANRMPSSTNATGSATNAPPVPAK